MQKIKELLGLNHYTSELDKFLSEFQSRPQTASQIQEAKKAARIAELRDQPSPPSSTRTVYDLIMERADHTGF